VTHATCDERARRRLPRLIFAGAHSRSQVDSASRPLLEAFKIILGFDVSTRFSEIPYRENRIVRFAICVISRSVTAGFRLATRSCCRDEYSNHTLRRGSDYECSARARPKSEWRSINVATSPGRFLARQCQVRWQDRLSALVLERVFRE